MIKILDTTLRDGSYVLNFQFSSMDTAIVATALDAAGLDYIEVGHGLGLGAGDKQEMRSAEPDINYSNAAAQSVRRSRWGTFFIPGVGDVGQLQPAAESGMHFVRIGTNVTEIRKAETSIRRAKDLGLEVFANLMKSYAVSAASVAETCRIAEDLGADCACVVDSAGGMLPEDVRRYVADSRAATSLPIAFHGHNNLGLGIANALAAVDAGASVIDASVRGLGRSAGNTVTEMLVFALKRRGIECGIDVIRLLDLAERFIDPLLRRYQQVESIGIVSGYAQFHSAFYARLKQFADRYEVDPRELIIRLTEVDKVNAPDALLERLAIDLVGQRAQSSKKRSVDIPLRLHITGGEKTTLDLSGVIEQLISLGKKSLRSTVFNIVQGLRQDYDLAVSHVLHEDGDLVLASAEVGSDCAVRELVRLIDGRVDLVLLDVDLKLENSRKIIGVARTGFVDTRVHGYSDLDAWVGAVAQMIERVAPTNCGDVLIVGGGVLGDFLFNRLSLTSLVSRIDVPEFSFVDLHSDQRIVVFCAPIRNDLSVPLADLSQWIFIDAWIGSCSGVQISQMTDAGAQVYRVDMEQAIQAQARMALAAQKSSCDVRNINTHEGPVDIVAGGRIGPQGAVVVDSVEKPTRIYGVADGRGGLLIADEITSREQGAIRLVEHHIIRQVIS